MKINLKKLMLFIYVFIYIFNPISLSSFNLILPLTLFAVAFIILDFESYAKIIYNSRIVIYCLLIIYLAAYIAFGYLFGEFDVIARAYSFILSLCSLICAVFISVAYSRIYFFDFKSFLDFVIRIASFQLLFVFISLLFPSVRDWILSSARSENLVSISNDYGGLRSYGLAAGYTSTFPMFMGMCALIVLANYEKTWLDKGFLKYSLLFLLFVASIILNARIGLAPVLVFLALSSILFILDVKKTLTYFCLTLFLFLISLPAIAVLDFEAYVVRLSWAFEEFSNLLGGERTGTFAALETMLFFPHEISELLFGNGKEVFGDQLNFENSSDIGIVRDIYLFGFVNVVLFFIVMVTFTKPLAKNLKDTFGSVFAASFFIALILFYLKGAIWTSSEIYNFLVLISVFSILLNAKGGSFEKNPHR